MSDENLDLSQHGFQDAKIVVNAPHSDTVTLTNLTLTDTNADTLQFIDGTFTNAATTATGSFALDPNGAAVADLYHATLNRDPDFSGLAYWKGELASGTVTQQQEASFFVNSPEFQATYGNLSNADFVNLLYENVLGRGADTAGASYWTNDLNNGISRGLIVSDFANSTEFAADLSAKGLVSATGGIQFLNGVAHA